MIEHIENIFWAMVRLLLAATFFIIAVDDLSFYHAALLAGGIAFAASAFLKVD